MNGPTTRQTAVHEALVRHGGVATSAARELAITETAVRQSERRYLEAMGQPPRPRPLSPRAIVAVLPARLTSIEERLEAIEAGLAAIGTGVVDLTSAAQSLRDQVRELNSRQPLFLVERSATHRRQADGGVGGKVERSGR